VLSRESAPISFHVSWVSDLDYYYARAGGLRPGAWTFVAAGFAIVFLGLAAASRILNWNSFWQFLVVGLAFATAALVAAGFLYWYRRQVRKQTRSLWSRRVEATIDATGVHTSSPGIRSDVEWSALTSVRLRHGMVELRRDGATVTTLPQWGFASMQEFTAALAFISERIAAAEALADLRRGSA
jgi:hypothetical protein